MPAVIQLIFRYILIGITTAVSTVTGPGPQVEPVPVYEAPNEVLTFLFDEPETAPVEVPVVVPIVPKPVPKPQPKPQPQPTIIATTYDAIVNILCIERVGSLTRTTTGSGVIISQNGIVLTNAHVAVDIMKGFTCSVRTGSPARGSHPAELLYIPDEWIEDNTTYITSGIAHASTGENDFALLQIMGNFPYIKIDETALSVGDTIETVGYPAERISLFSPASNLSRISDETTIKKVYSFGLTHTDVFSTGTVDNAEQGSSGGAIISDGRLAGIIVTVNSGTINALSIGYISEYFENDTDTELSSLLR